MRGLAKKSNTRPGGVLVVFGLLIVPAASAAIFYTGVLQRLVGAWLIGSIACAIGIGASAQWDLPTGASVVTALGAVFACLAFAERFVNTRRSDGPL